MDFGENRPYERKKEIERWGLPLADIERLGDRLATFYHRFASFFRTRTRDTSAYGLQYVSGLLRMETKRNIANIGRKTAVAEQNLQHFISQSPWRGPGVIEAVDAEIAVHPAFADALLVLDESAEGKAGDQSVGAGRQHNGRLGKVEMSQVGVFLALVTPAACTWVDGELYLPLAWFDEAHAPLRQKVGVPAERVFQTKPELGWQLIQRAQARHLPFQAVVMDDLYGRNVQLRDRLHQAQLEYYGDVPHDTRVYLEPPTITHPLTRQGKPTKQARLTGPALTVQAVGQQADLAWQTLRLRANERGYLEAAFARRRVWVVYGETCRQEWLLIRRDAKQITYVLSNAPETLDLPTMAWRKTHRYLIERSNEDAKDELGWDEAQTRKYRAWEHQLALTILASWFVAETRLDWQTRYAPDPDLLTQYEVDVLPKLSVANVRELLRAALPLPQLSPEEAAQLVMAHLINRTRSRKSRLRPRKDPTP